MSFKLFGPSGIECPACKKEISTDADTCPNCGNNMREFKIFTTTTNCDGCGEKVSTDADVCPKCGHDLKSFSLFASHTTCSCCGGKISGKAKICPHCGQDLEHFKLFSTSTTCGNCGNKVSTDSQYCPSCGEDVKAFKLFSSKAYCNLWRGIVSSDAERCPHCGEQIRKYGSYTTTAPNQIDNSGHFSNDNHKGNNGVSDVDGYAGLIKLGVIIGLIWLIIWLITKVIIPLFFINITVIMFLIGYMKVKYQKYLFPLCGAGLLLLRLDFSKGWFTNTFALAVPSMAGLLPVLFYINLLAGLTGIYLYIRGRRKQKGLFQFPEFSKPNLIIMGALVLTGVAISLIPYWATRRASATANPIQNTQAVNTAADYPTVAEVVPADSSKHFSSNTINYYGQVGNLNANFSLSWGSDGHITGSYYYPDRNNTTYTLAGELMEDGRLLLTEFTNNLQTAACDLTWTNNCYTGQMRNNDGRVLPMQMCTTQDASDTTSVEVVGDTTANIILDSATLKMYVANIKAEFQRINKASLIKETENLYGSRVDYFKENEAIVKIATVCYNYDKKTISEYYFKNNELFFIYRVFGKIAADSSLYDKREYRSYIYNRKTIKYIANQEVRPCIKCEYDERSVEYQLLRANSSKSFPLVPCYNEDSQR